jgi:hypothetical protein
VAHKSWHATKLGMVEYKINILAPAWGREMVARGEVLTADQRLFVCKVEVVAVSGEGEETPCAALQQTPCGPTATSSSGCPLP